MSTFQITASVASELSQLEIDTTRFSTSTLGTSARLTVRPGQFVFFAAFDGTNNDRGNVTLSGTPQRTNVAQLESQLADGNAANSNFQSRYYAGAGTGGISGGFDARSTNPTPYLTATAERALTEFAIEAKAWLDADPTRSAGDINAAMTGFSRGAGTAVIFSRLLNERGLVLPDGTILVPPGQVPVVSTLLFDPVFSGIEGNLSLPPNVSGNVVVVQAMDEFRYMFKAADFSNDPRVQVVAVFGNHGNIGGMYDNGIGALVLEGATAFFGNSGLSIAPVPAERQFDSSQSPKIYSEGVDSYGHRIWSEYGSRGNRLTVRVPPPELSDYQSDRIESISRTDNSVADPRDLTELVAVVFKDGNVEQQLLNGAGQPVLTIAPNETLTRNTSGTYLVQNSDGFEIRSYDPITGELTYRAPGRATTVVDEQGNLLRLIEPSGVTAEITVINGEAFMMSANGIPYRRGVQGAIELRDPANANGVLASVASNGQVTITGAYASVVNADGSVGRVIFNRSGVAIGAVLITVYDDGSSRMESRFADGRTSVNVFSDDSSISSRITTTPAGHNTEQIDSYTYDSVGRPIQQSSITVQTFYDENGTSRLETVTTYGGGIPTTVRNAYDTDGQLASSTPVENPAATQLLGQRSVTTLNDIAGLIGAIQGGRPLPILNSGLRLINNIANPAGTVVQYPGLNIGTGIVSGLASLYNLANALEHGDTLTKVSATLNTLNYVNSTLPALFGATSALSPALNTVLNGSGGLISGAAPGVLPVLGLIVAIKNEDPVGIAIGLIGICNPALLATPPAGWIVVGVLILQALMKDPPPEAWGTAKVIFDGNGQIRIDSVGESFGIERVRGQLTVTLDVLGGMLAEAKLNTPGVQLGIVPQRLPAITWRESRQGDPGYAVLDINPLTGEQRYPNLRFADNSTCNSYQKKSCSCPKRKGHRHVSLKNSPVAPPQRAIRNSSPMPPPRSLDRGNRFKPSIRNSLNLSPIGQGKDGEWV